MIENRHNFGWTYIHFIDPIGTRINVVVHKTDIFGGGGEYMSMIIKPEGDPVRFKGEQEYRFGNGEFSFRFGDTSFEGDIYDVDPNTSLSDIKLYQEESAGKVSNWLVDIPYAKFKGRLKGDIPQKVAGFVYQDRQWGNLMLQDWVSDWVWGHFASERLYLIFFHILSQTGEIITHGLWKDLETGFSQKVESLKARYFETLRDSSLKEQSDIMGEIELGTGETISMGLLKNSIMRQRVGEDHGSFQASYLRWSAFGYFNRQDEADRVTGVTEYLKIR